MSLCRFQSQPVLKGPSERPPLAQGWNETDLEQKKQICQLLLSRDAKNSNYYVIIIIKRTKEEPFLESLSLRKPPTS